MSISRVDTLNIVRGAEHEANEPLDRPGSRIVYQINTSTLTSIFHLLVKSKNYLLALDVSIN